MSAWTCRSEQRGESSEEHLYHREKSLEKVFCNKDPEKALLDTFDLEKLGKSILSLPCEQIHHSFI